MFYEKHGFSEMRMKTISIIIPTKYEQLETTQIERVLQTFLEEFLEEYFERIEDQELRNQLQNNPRIHALTHPLAKSLQ